MCIRDRIIGDIPAHDRNQLMKLCFQKSIRTYTVPKISDIDVYKRQILTYAYSQTIYSSRKIETACKRDINFMWLLAGQKAPDHSTIARFRSGFLEEACEDLFYQMVHRLERCV